MIQEMSIEEAVQRSLLRGYSNEMTYRKDNLALDQVLMEEQPGHFAVSQCGETRQEFYVDDSGNPVVKYLSLEVATGHEYRELPPESFVTPLVNIDSYFTLLEDLVDYPNHVQKYVEMLDPRVKENVGEEFPSTYWVYYLFGLHDHAAIYFSGDKDKITAYMKDKIVPLFSRDLVNDNGYNYTEHVQGLSVPMDIWCIAPKLTFYGNLGSDLCLHMCHGQRFPFYYKDTNSEKSKKTLHALKQVVNLMKECPGLTAIYLTRGDYATFIPAYIKK